jgi:acyl-[acyl-carrier-protein]-phospholipid O-acyltransferase / long-chain-fatty-acid--[acyl-carrier-protein] ligase
MLRLILSILTHTIYRIRTIGQEHIPSHGPALLVSNHLSLVDGFLVGVSVPRPVRFMMWRPYYEAKAFHWLFRAMKAIPISEKDPPKGILRSLMVARKALEDGEVVCVFAEGEISRTGNLLEFKKGFEVILKGLDVPVIPVHLDRVWGSIFSFEHGKVLWKRPRKIPYPVTLTFGPPVSRPINAETVRQAVLDLSVEAFRLRLEDMQSLPLEFIKRAKRQPSTLAVVDSSRAKMSFGRLAAASKVLSDMLRSKTEGAGDHIGILLPPSVGGAMANVSVSLLRKVPVNLNYTTGSPAIAYAMQKARITHVLTSRQVLEKTGLELKGEILYVEDLVKELSGAQVVKERILFSLLPLSLLLKRYARGSAGPRAGGESLQETAAIIFSSGSTGIPKGIVLSHANILSNIVALMQVFDLGKQDRMLGVLPFFHSFGFTATLWYPLIGGFAAVYHVNPLDAKMVGKLSQRHSVSVLLATPTFLSAYIRKCEPAQFKHLRYVITGAERLPESTAKAFEEKFGKRPLEGYGCTELSPVAAVNVPNVSMGEINQVGNKAGKIGHPIPGVSVKIVDPETFEPIPQGKQGLLLVKGLNVMKGYLDEPEKTAEVMREGWYVTGDIARVDPDGFVELVDRLSRFSKIGGEMVPHILIEEKLNQLAGGGDPSFVVTSAPDEKRGEQLVVLHCPLPVPLDDIYRRLQASDLPKLWIPARDRFFEIPIIPLLGTGKIDLPAIQQAAARFINRPLKING